MKKHFFISLIAAAFLSLSAGEKKFEPVPVNFKQWTTVQGKLQKHVKKYVQFDSKGLRLNGQETAFGYFCTVPIACKAGDKLKIRLELSGTGTVQPGFLEYKSGYTYAGTLQKKLKAVKRPLPYELNFTVTASQATLVRPVIFVDKGAQVVICDLAVLKAK